MPFDTPSGFPVAELEYELPERLIAQQPPDRRDDARMLVVNRAAGSVSDSSITELPAFLASQDLLVFNNTKVLPAKIAARRQTGGNVSGLFINERADGSWRVMWQGSRRLRTGETLSLLDTRCDSHDLATVTLEESLGDGHWIVRPNTTDSAQQVLQRVGQTPLPPYIRRKDADARLDELDQSRYQTVYASQPGAIAAPTAGLHFSEALLDKLAAQGVGKTFVTLHVGIGTFKPVSVDELSHHEMHSEQFELTKEACKGLDQCKSVGGRVVAVGTTSVRVLETAGAAPVAQSGDTDIFIYPPHDFAVVDCLLTNFHLPRSTLLALVMAFGGVDLIRKAYRHAVERQYRFFSYGDAMLIV